jgi:hypothetical protein
MQDRVDDELDVWLPESTLRVHHRRRSSASPEALWQAASALRIDEAPVLGRLIQWRIPGTGRKVAFDRLLREPPFMVLAEPERGLISGLVGRIWTLRRDYPVLAGPAEFRDWTQPGTARVVIASWAAEDRSGGALCAEARVQGLGRQGQVGVAAVRPLVRAFQQLIATEALGTAVRRAERA